MSKETKFNDLAIKRVNKAINMIKLIGNLSNKSHYKYTPQQAKKIIAALEDEVKEIKIKFLSKAKDDDKFNFN